MNKVKLITADGIEDFESEVNTFLAILEKEALTLVNMQFTTTPTAVATHTEYGVYPTFEYSVLIHYKA